MKIKKNITLTVIYAIAIIGGLMFVNSLSRAVSLSDKQLDSIRNNCISAKTSLNQLHVSDALLRVNMGQSYESIASKLMDGLNSRMVKNGYESSNFSAITSEYRQKLDVFRADYKKYEEQMTRAIAVDCSIHPDVFFQAVDLARLYRQTVHSDILDLNKHIDQYQSAVIKFEKDYKNVINGSES